MLSKALDKLSASEPFQWNELENIASRDVMAVADIASESGVGAPLTRSTAQSLRRAFGEKQPSESQLEFILRAMMPAEGRVTRANFLCAVVFWQLQTGSLEELETMHELVRSLGLDNALQDGATLETAQLRLCSASLDGGSGSWGDLIDVTSEGVQRRLEAFGVARDGQVVHAASFLQVVVVVVVVAATSP